MLQLQKLSKSFDGSSVIKDFSYDLKSNSIYMLEGPNGVGKTTLLKMVRGILTQDQGIISMSCGTRHEDCSTYIDANHRSFLHRLTVKENLEYFVALNMKIVCPEMVQSLMEEFEIYYLKDKVFSSLSVGQMQLIGIIRGLLEQPKLLLLDEALNNLDHNRVKNVANYLEDFVKSNNRIVIICSHTKLPINSAGTVQLK